MDCFSNLVPSATQSIKKVRKTVKSKVRYARPEQNGETSGQNKATPNGNENQQAASNNINKHDALRDKKYDNKRAKLQVYNDIDRDYFNSNKPTNPLDFIEKD